MDKKSIQKLIAKDGFIEVNMKGNSMDPILKDGDKVIVKRVDPKYLKKFQIILFWQNDALVTHYIRHLLPPESNTRYDIITKGIKNNYLDRPISFSDVLGIVDKQIPLYIQVKNIIGDLIRRKDLSGT